MNTTNVSSKNVVVFADSHDLGQLCSLHLKLTNVANENANSVHQAHVIKCRQLIFTENDIIASPHCDDNSYILIVMPQSLFKTGRLQARFVKHELQAGKPMRVLPDVFKACANYTILAKMAPNWNRAGPWLIQGRDFLTSSGCMNAVKFDVNVTNDDFYFTIQAACLRVPAAQISDFGSAGSAYYDFLLKQEGHISDNHLQNAWCHVLPSMKKGRVVEINNSIPQGSLFDSYRDLKRFWKNNYGYRLPEMDDDMLYYQIHFLPIPNTTFTYPSVCIRSRDFHNVPRIDPKPILQEFLRDLISRVPQLCGTPLKFQPKAHYPEASLNPAIQVDNNKLINLSTRLPTSEKNVALRNPYTMQKLFPHKIISQTSVSSSNSNNNIKLNAIQAQENAKSSGNNTKQISVDSIKSKPDFCSNSEVPKYECGSQVLSGNYSDAKKKVPVFKKKNATSTKEVTDQKQKVIPNFSKKTKPIVNQVGNNTHEGIEDVFSTTLVGKDVKTTVNRCESSSASTDEVDFEIKSNNTVNKFYNSTQYIDVAAVKRKSEAEKGTNVKKLKKAQNTEKAPKTPKPKKDTKTVGKQKSTTIYVSEV